MAQTLAYDVTPGEVQLRIEAKVRNPNVGRVVSTILRAGPKSFRFATLYEIIDPASQAHHHWCLKLDSIDRTKRQGWVPKPDRSLTLGEGNELADLARIIQTALSGGLSHDSGEYALIPAAAQFRSLLKLAKGAESSQRIKVVQAFMQNLDAESILAEDWLRVFEQGEVVVSQTIAASARLVEYRRVRHRLAGLISDGSVKEQEIQRLLSDHPWLFGSEYSELLERRNWTRDERLDFMLRRTADNYLEVVEIKTPMKEPLFRHDPSHDSYAPGSALSLAIGQVVNYIDAIERNRDGIIAKDGCDPSKIRARIIIGCDGDLNQQAALRNLNGHLHRIEVVTFDQLLRIADRVLAIFSTELQRKP